MSSAIAVLEKLLNDESVNNKEHLLETASPHILNAEQRFEQSFDTIVREISTIWGDPEFNSQIKKGDDELLPAPGEEEEAPEGEQPQEAAERKERNLSTVVPAWSRGTARSGGQIKALRLAHWKRPDGLMYIVLRTELDPKKNDRPLYYDLILGARRRKQEVDRGSERLRQTEENWKSQVVQALNWLRGR
ncbi:MAG TPA: hypothetical protein V6C81_24205 [Planktothrix sp.]|jgi:hypothetical protein